jgi:hypothetical protein
MTTTDHNHTVEYAESVAHTIRRLEEIAGRWPENPTAHLLTVWADEWQHELQTYPERYTNAERADTWTDIENARADAAWLDENAPDRDDESQSFADRYCETALEFTYHGTYNYSSKGWECDEVRVLISFGGPTARLIWHYNTDDAVTVAVSWWGDQHRINVYAPHLAEYLHSLTQVMT